MRFSPSFDCYRESAIARAITEYSTTNGARLNIRMRVVMMRGLSVAGLLFGDSFASAFEYAIMSP